MEEKPYAVRYSVGGRNHGTPNDMTEKAYANMEELRKTLPEGYNIEIAGSLEESRKSVGYLMAPLSVMIVIIFTVLMLQLKKLSLALIALLTVPLGLIGVFLAMFFRAGLWGLSPR